MQENTAFQTEPAGSVSNQPELHDPGLEPIDSKDEAEEQKAHFQPVNEEKSLKDDTFQALKSDFQALESNSQAFESDSQELQSDSATFESDSHAFKSDSLAFKSDPQAFKSGSPALESNSQAFQSDHQALKSFSPAVKSDFQAFESCFRELKSDSETLKSNLQTLKSGLLVLKTIFPSLKPASEEKGSGSQALTSGPQAPGSEWPSIEPALLELRSSLLSLGSTLPKFESSLLSLESCLLPFKPGLQVLNSNAKSLISTDKPAGSSSLNKNTPAVQKELLPLRNKISLVFTDDNTVESYEIAPGFDRLYFQKERRSAEDFLKVINKFRNLCNNEIQISLKQFYYVFRAIKAQFPTKRFVFMKELKLTALLLFINKKTTITYPELEQTLGFGTAWLHKLVAILRKKQLVGLHRSAKGNYLYIGKEARKFVEATLEMKELNKNSDHNS